jgi:hypothetical protein
MRLSRWRRRNLPMKRLIMSCVDDDETTTRLTKKTQTLVWKELLILPLNRYYERISKLVIHQTTSSRNLVFREKIW